MLAVPERRSTETGETLEMRPMMMRAGDGTHGCGPLLVPLCCFCSAESRRQGGGLRFVWAPQDVLGSWWFFVGKKQTESLPGLSQTRTGWRRAQCLHRPSIGAMDG